MAERSGSGTTRRAAILAGLAGGAAVLAKCVHQGDEGKGATAEPPPATRTIARTIPVIRTREGAGFEVRRPFPTRAASDLDPFLLLDHLGPSVYGPNEAIGAPEHPHRGFEAISYLLKGRLEHKDSLGNVKHLDPGDAQYLTMGGGIVHSEMPEPTFYAEGGTMEAFQVWVNLARVDKRVAPSYCDLPKDKLPTRNFPGGVVRVIAGTFAGLSSPVQVRAKTLFSHVTLDPGGTLTADLPRALRAAVYLFEGEAKLGGQSIVASSFHELAPDGDAVTLTNAGGSKLEAIVLGGKAIGEPIARYGPFVMNTDEEVREAFADYRSGRMGRIRV